MRPAVLPFLLALCSSVAEAGTPIRSTGNFGLGIGGGTITSGLSGKYFLSDAYAVQGVVGWWGAGYGQGGIGVSADFLVEQPSLHHDEVVEIAWNWGGGGTIASSNFGGLILGANATVGLEFNFEPAPIDLVVEWRPGIFAGSGGLGIALISLGAHVRVYPF